MTTGSYTVLYDYNASPTLRRFSESRKRIRYAVGPFGSGKSSACVMEIYQKACEQEPDTRGKRRTRWAVVRNSYPELRDTTIKTLLDWFPPEYFGKFRQNPTPDYQINQKLSDGTEIECEILFRALDRPDHVRNLLSLEVTGAWLNEVKEIEKIIFDAMDGRIDRYPAKRDGGASWAGIFMDTNPCDTDHWLYKLFVDQLPNDPELQEKYDYFHQPSGLSPEAENLPYLPKNYYQNMAVGKDANFIKVYIHGQYGYVREGKIIYTNYNDLDHCSLVPIEPWRGVHLTLGWDFGLTPACVLTQFHPRGNLHVLKELCATEMGVKRLARDVVRPYLIANFNGYRYVSGCDPSGARRSEVDETKSCYKELKESGFPVKLAYSNNLEPRFTSVDNFLLMGKIEGKPAFQLDPSCKLLRKGFNGEYKRRKLNVSGAEIYADAPEKNSVCVPIHAQALTPQGWKFHDELNAGENIYVYDFEKNGVKIGTVEGINFFPGEHKLIRLSHSQIDFYSTPNHRNIIKSRNGVIKEVTTEQLKQGHSLFCPPPEIRPRKQQPFSKFFISLAAWVMAEGSYRQNDEAITLCQSRTANPEYVKYLNELVRENSCVITHGIQDANPGKATWRIRQELAWALRYWMPNKIPSPDFVARMSNVNRRVFLYEFMRGDGNFSNGHGDVPDPPPGIMSRAIDLFISPWTIRAFQKRKEAIDTLQMISTLAGIPSNIKKQHKEAYFSKSLGRPMAASDGYQISLCRKQRFADVQFLKREEIITTDGVWCPTTSNGTWLCRQNGRVFVTGNSHPHEALQYACMTIERGITPDRSAGLGHSRQSQPPPPVKAFY